MGAIEKVEDDLFEGAGFLILFFIIGMGILGYMAAKSIALPDGAYPGTIFSKFASWVDGVFFNMPEFSKPFVAPLRSSVDERLAEMMIWIEDNLPKSPEMKKALNGDTDPDNPYVDKPDADYSGNSAVVEVNE